MRRSELGPRLLGAALAATALLATATASADPKDRYLSDLGACSEKYDGVSSFTCSICGVTAGCDGRQCRWGDVRGTEGSDGFDAGLSRGYLLYCVNQGGTLVSAASPVGIQARSVDGALRALSKGAASTIGGIAEYTKFDGSSDPAYGLVVPVQWALDDRRLLSALVLAGHVPGVNQAGVNARMTWGVLPKREDARSTLLIGVPVQATMLSGDAISTSFGFAGGASALYGATTESGGLGVGVALDALYVRGFQAPLQVAGRLAFGPDKRFAVQPALATDLRAPSEAIQPNVLAGVELGRGGAIEALGLSDAVAGVQVFLRGSDVTASLGITGSHAALGGAARRAARPKPGEAVVAPGGCESHDACPLASVCLAGKCVEPRRYEPKLERFSAIVVAKDSDLAAYARGVVERAIEGTRFAPIPESELAAALGDRRRDVVEGRALSDDDVAALSAVAKTNVLLQVTLEEPGEEIRAKLLLSVGPERRTRVVSAPRAGFGGELRAAVRALLGVE